MQPNGAAFGGATVKGEHTADNDLIQKLFSNHVPTPNVNSPQVNMKQHGDLRINTPATPTPMMKSIPHGEVQEGVYASMHERFGRGDLAHDPSQAASNLFSDDVQNNFNPQNAMSGGQATQEGNGDNSIKLNPTPISQSWGQGVGGTNTASADTTVTTQGNAASSVDAPSLAYLLANAVADSSGHNQAQVHVAPNPGFPAMVDNNNNIVQSNPLQPTHVPVQHAQPGANGTAEAVGYVTVPNTDENPAAELKKNGEPKKRTGRKRSEFTYVLPKRPEDAD